MGITNDHLYHYQSKSTVSFERDIKEELEKSHRLEKFSL